MKNPLCAGQHTGFYSDREIHKMSPVLTDVAKDEKHCEGPGEPNIHPRQNGDVGGIWRRKEVARMYLWLSHWQGTVAHSVSMDRRKYWKTFLWNVTIEVDLLVQMHFNLNQSILTWDINPISTSSIFGISCRKEQRIYPKLHHFTFLFFSSEVARN